MVAEWHQVSLGDLCSLITDGKHGDCKNESGSGYYFLSVKDVYDNRLVYEEARQIAKNDFLETHRRTNLEPGDILFTNTGTIGRMAIVPDDPRTRRTTFQKSVAILKPKRNLVEPHFLYYALKFDNARLSELAAGTTQKNLLLKDFRTFEIRLPDLGEQRAIAHILGTLDDKIEVNRRMNATLEAMARALFRSWFVDFDPVQAKAEGREPAGMDAETAALFPDEFEESELGEIPKGWKVGSLEDIASNPKRGVKPGDVCGTTPYIGLEHMPRRSISIGEWGYAVDVQSNKSAFQSGEFLFGKLRPYFHKVGIAPIDGVCSTDILVVAPKEDIWSSFVLMTISSDEFIEYTSSASTGTKMPRTSWEMMTGYPIVLPPEEIVSRFETMMLNAFNHIVQHIHESRSLACSRDALLPRLLSGEISMPLS